MDKNITNEALILQFARNSWGEKDLAGIALKLSEETGEVAGACVKISEGRTTIMDVQDEVGDVLFVIAQLAAAMDTTIEDLLHRRITRRHPKLKLLDELEDFTLFDVRRVGQLTDLNQHELYTNEQSRLMHMRDPSLFLKCMKCKNVELLPIDQTRYDFKTFTAEHEHSGSPDGAFYKCNSCVSPHHVYVAVDEGEPE